jgi:nucleoside-diphosphate-sugar epimerase
VLALSRRAPLSPLEIAPDVTWMRTGFLADGERRDQVIRHPPPDCLVSCAPLDLAVRLVLRHPGLRQVVAFSSSSVLSKATSGNAEERRRMEAMAADEDALRAACGERGMPLLLLRPTLIYGCGRDRNISLLAGLARRFGAIPLSGKAGGRRQPVHADDLAALAVRALSAADPPAMISEVCGGSILTYREMVRRVAAVAPGTVRLVTLPVGLMIALVWLLSLVPAWRGLGVEMVRRQNRDLVFDDSALRRALDWSPRPFEPTAADFEVPDYARPFQLPAPPPQERL